MDPSGHDASDARDRFEYWVGEVIELEDALAESAQSIADLEVMVAEANWNLARLQDILDDHMRHEPRCVTPNDRWFLWKRILDQLEKDVAAATGRADRAQATLDRQRAQHANLEASMDRALGELGSAAAAYERYMSGPGSYLGRQSASEMGIAWGRLAALLGAASARGMEAVRNVTQSAARAAAAARAVREAVRRVDPNKVNHIMNEARHRMDPLIRAFGGDRTAATRAIQQAAHKAAKASGKMSGAVETITVRVRGIGVQVSGRAVNGAFRVGTAKRRP
jgi:hypothetical protein